MPPTWGGELMFLVWIIHVDRHESTYGLTLGSIKSSLIAQLCNLRDLMVANAREP
jgi:hypothetical protein